MRDLGEAVFRVEGSDAARWPLDARLLRLLGRLWQRLAAAAGLRHRGTGTTTVAPGLTSYFIGRGFDLPDISIACAADEQVRSLLLPRRWQGRGWLSHARDTQRRVRG